MHVGLQIIGAQSEFWAALALYEGRFTLRHQVHIDRHAHAEVDEGDG